MRIVYGVTLGRDIQQFISDLPSAFEHYPSKLIYKGRNTLREFTFSDNSQIIVKKFKTAGILKSLSYFIAPNKAQRAFKNSIMYLREGVPTPAALAYVECRKLGMIRNLFFITAPDYTPDLVKTLRRKDFNEVVVRKLCQFIINIHSKNIVHGDLNLSNILYDGSKFSVIDTNRSRKIKKITDKSIIRDLRRITHRRDLLKCIAREYWNQMSILHPNVYLGKSEEFTKRLIKSVLQMEYKKRILHKLTRRNNR